MLARMAATLSVTPNLWKLLTEGVDDVASGTLIRNSNVRHLELIGVTSLTERHRHREIDIYVHTSSKVEGET